ncbi:MAG: DUF3048 domain-containing protein [Clostridia bacterium]|nr:DUF3048 domain-containing protein [Clostridia bacterium]
MTKRLLLCLLAACMVLCVGCKRQEFSELAEEAVVITPTEIDPPEIFYPNPLTGIKELKEDAQNKRPVAVMINNISVAQEVQCGLNDADVVFECLVEGGISRLMAVYYDVEPVKQIGSIRSARYTYAELCKWLDAVYVHHGSDTRYAVPYMKEIELDHYEVNNTSGFRAENGLSWEHRLYTDGEKLTKALKDGKFRLTNEEPTKPIFTFGDAASPVTPATPCDSVTFAMSPSNKTTFTYDPQTQKYVRSPSGKVHKDYRTKEDTVTDNVIILYANSPHFEDNYHVKTKLTSGKGLYVSKGGSQTIRWEKNGDSNDLVLMDEEGKPLTINPGSSWIAFPPTSGQPESKPETKTSVN